MRQVETKLTGKTLSGEDVGFSYAAFSEAMDLYSLKNIEAVVERVENEVKEKSGVADFLSMFGFGKKSVEKVPQEVALFFRDLAIIQEVDHPDHDLGMAIGTLATRIELALDMVPADIRTEEFYDQLAEDRREYDYIFG